MALSRVASGVLYLTVSGLTITVQLVLSKLLLEWGWPFFRMMGTSAALLALVIAVALAAVGAELPSRQRTWVLLRGGFGTCAVALSFLAVRLGAGPGDVGSLASINTIAAALLGRIFLGEALRRVHLIALICSLTGAVLISQPSFLFGGVAANSHWLAYLLAVASGVFFACVFIAARKAEGASVWHHAMPACAVSAFVWILLPCTPLVEEASLSQMVASPVQALGWLAWLVMSSVVSITTNSAGSKLCPAAVSATVSTASRMVFGYLAQVLIFGMGLNSYTLTGAGLMLVAVVIMAIARVPEIAPAEVATLPVGLDGAVDTDAVEEEDETESLASFIAAEFAEQSPHSLHDKSVRLRRFGKSLGIVPVAQSIGVVTCVAPVVA